MLAEQRWNLEWRSWNWTMGLEWNGTRTSNSTRGTPCQYPSQGKLLCLGKAIHTQSPPPPFPYLPQALPTPLSLLPHFSPLPYLPISLPPSLPLSPPPPSPPPSYLTLPLPPPLLSLLPPYLDHGSPAMRFPNSPPPLSSLPTSIVGPRL